jgi:hypothetical protein
LQVTAIVRHIPFADVPNGHSAGDLGSIKNLAQPGLLSVVVLTITTMVRGVVVVSARMNILGVGRLDTRRHHGTRHGAFNQLIEFTAIKPHAPALRAIVNLDPLAIAHQEVRVRANRAFHTDSILSVWAIDTMLQASRGGLVESLWRSS